jgi:guanyl-specific ribonuclease Sa
MRKAGILDEAIMASMLAVPGIALLSTRFLGGVTVVDRRTGSTIVGTVDLQPTFDRITAGIRDLHPNDGSTFKNIAPKGQPAPLLPLMPNGYYTEYVVRTPGISAVGPQRVITGVGGDMYYTPDHYTTFIRVR